MSVYEIKRWDAMSTNNNKFPVIYVSPDETLLGASAANNSVLMCKIENTGSIYDDKSIAGVIISSGSFPNQRPNFFKSTGLYAVQLVSDWHGYPPNEGIVRFSGLNEIPESDDKDNTPDSIPTPEPKPEPTPPKPEEKEKEKEPDTSENSLSTSQIIIILAAIILVIIMVIAFTRKTS